MKQIVNKKVYDTETANLVADDRYWDGSNYDRNGRNNYLFKTSKGEFFTYHQTCWQGERDRIEPVNKDVAMELYETLPEQSMSYQDAFNVIPEQA
jgi:hypothetical protein